MSTYTECSESTLSAALKLAKGKYQVNLLHGIEAWSGSTLRGSAKSWGAKYAASRDSLVARLRGAGFACTWAKREHGRRVLVLCQHSDCAETPALAEACGGAS